MIFHRVAGPLIWIGMVGLATPESLAQATVQARMAATAYAPVPAGAGITVDYREDTLLNSRLRAIFEGALRDRGYRVADKAEFILTFETLVEEKPAADKPASVFGSAGSSSGRELGFELRLPLDKPKMAVGGRRYSLNVSLARPGKAPAWVASAVAVAAQGDRLAVQSAMVEVVVDALGETVASRPIRIQ